MKYSIQKSVTFIFLIAVSLILVQIGNALFDNQVTRFGIYPRSLNTLPHIFLAPFIHGSWGHLVNNLVVFCIFSFLCLNQGIKYYAKASLFIIVFSGVLVWALARPAFHIGASGWIFGLFGLLIARAWYQRSFVNFAIALFIVFFYGGMIFGVLPTNSKVSFEFHLAGLLSGFLFAKKIRTRSLIN